MQVDTWIRGFSYAYDAPLDMRMDPDLELTAHEIVNTWDERRLARLLREYGEERYSSQIARAIARTRRAHELSSTHQLVEVIKTAVPVPAQFAGGHPARRTFQALRIAVNDELTQLDDALPIAWDLLRPGGRFAAISFHSLEDRRVKRFLADRARGCICPPEIPICVCGHEPEAELLTRRAVAPTPGEIAANPRSKSAHLRAARKLEEAALDTTRRHPGRGRDPPPPARSPVAATGRAAARKRTRARAGHRRSRRAADPALEARARRAAGRSRPRSAYAPGRSSGRCPIIRCSTG